MVKYKTHSIDDEGWTSWILPLQKGYKMSCCDCGLVHDMEFKIDMDKVMFRARRNNKSTAAKRRILK